MKKLLFVVSLLAIMGCGIENRKPMSNEEIIAEVKFCEENGLCADVLVGGWEHERRVVICKPCEDKKE